MTSHGTPVTGGRTGSAAHIEVLEQEPPRASRRSRLGLGVLVLALTGLGVHDRQALAAEQARVAGCRDAASAALVLADRRVSSMASYVFPALSGAYTSAVREGLAGLVGGAAERAVDPVAAARANCTAVDVRPWHGQLQGRLDACLETLDVRLDWLGQVQVDGTEAFRSAPAPAADCRNG